MNKKLMIGAGIVVAVMLGVAAYAFSTAETDKDGNVTFFTSKTTDSQATESSEKQLPDNKQDKSQTKKPRTTEYRALDTDHFQNNATKTRFIFFKKTGDEISDQVHSLIVTHLKELKKDVIIYHTDVDESRELATRHGITRAGSVLKFNSQGTVNGAYIAPERPQLEQLRQILDI